MKPPIDKLSSPKISSSKGSKLLAGISEVMRLTLTSDGRSFLGAIGCTRPRPLSPRLGGESSFVPVAAVGVVVAGAVFGAESFTGTGFEGVADLGVAGAGASVCAIGASTSAAIDSAAFSASALASAS